MNRSLLRGVLVCAVSMGMAASALAQSALPVPGSEAAKDVPGAKMLPDPNMTYKVLFDVSKASPKPDEVNPILDAAARYINTLAKYGVPADHRQIAVIFHQAGTDFVMNNDAYKERTGHDNPNAAMIHALKKAGVELHVCGQGVLARKIDQKNIMPEVQTDVWALTTIVEMEMHGYVRIGG